MMIFLVFLSMGKNLEKIGKNISVGRGLGLAPKSIIALLD